MDISVHPALDESYCKAEEFLSSNFDYVMVFKGENEASELNRDLPIQTEIIHILLFLVGRNVNGNEQHLHMKECYHAMRHAGISILPHIDD